MSQPTAVTLTFLAIVFVLLVLALDGYLAGRWWTY